MSKETDKDVVDPDAAQPMRLRRNTSLRVPSDIVPRNNTEGMQAATTDDVVVGAEDEPSDGEVLAPIEDESFISVALPHRVDARASERVATVPPESASGRQEEDPVEQAPTNRATASASSVGGQTGVGEDELESRATVQMPAITEEMLRALVGEEGADNAPNGDLETFRTREMPAIRLEELGLSMEDSEQSAGDEYKSAADSGDIPIDEGEPAPASEAILHVPRAPTLSLSDDDLEELMDSVDGKGRFGRKSPSRSAREEGHVEPDTEMVPALDDPDAVEIDTGDDTDEPGGEDNLAARHNHHIHMAVRSEPGVPAAVAALENAGMESPLDTPLDLGPDAGDSAELISDDLIEEVDDSEVEVQPQERRPSPPPAPPVAAATVKKPPPSPRPQSAGSKLASDALAAALAKGKRRKGKPWFEEIFDEDYLRTLPFLMPQATQSEAAFVASALEVELGSQILDVGCGYGRHAMELAARGYQVVALDLSLPLLLRGADEAQRRGLNINFVHSDMRKLDFDSQFHGAYCLFSTFGYFDDETNKKAMRGIAQSLQPGGRLVIEVLNRDYLIEDLPARVWWEGDGCVVLEEVDFNYFSSRIVSNRSVVFDDGRQLEQEISVRAYSLHEFGKLLHSTGFRVLEVSGSMAMRGRFFGSKSRAIIVVAEKRSPKEVSLPRASTSSDDSSQ